MRNALPKSPLYRECGIVNLDNKNGPGTHWTAYRKIGNKVTYFNSFGSLQPPRELISYFGKNVTIFFNKRRYQSLNSTNCGILCVKFLKNKL